MTLPNGLELHQLRLGKLAPRRDRRTLQLARYLDLAALPPTPPERFWSLLLRIIGLMANDRIGDCTFATIGHIIQVLSANNGDEVTIPDSAIIAAYAAVTGYNPQTGANDNGANILDVLNYWRTTGVGGHRLGAYAAVDLHNHDLVRAAIDLFGSVYIGIWLPNSAKAQVGGVWDVPPGGPHGEGEPGSWGGHAANAPDFNQSNPAVITWGMRQALTWAFWDAYVDECYAPIAPEWFNGQLQAPSGFNLAELTRDLALVSGQPDPGPPTPPQPPQPAGWQAKADAAVDTVIADLGKQLQRKPGSYVIKAELAGANKARAAIDQAAP